jgi:hypothetical protein
MQHSPAIDACDYSATVSSPFNQQLYRKERRDIGSVPSVLGLLKLVWSIK